MTAVAALTPFRWLSVSEERGGSALGFIFSVAFFRGLTPAEVVRRFTGDAGLRTGYDGLNERVQEFLDATDGGDGGGYVGVVAAGGWSVAIEPYGWTVTLPETVTELSRGCEMLAITRHDYAAHALQYAIDGTSVTGVPFTEDYLRRPMLVGPIRMG